MPDVPYIVKVTDGHDHVVEQVYTCNIPARFVGPQRSQQEDAKYMALMINTFSAELLHKAPFRCVVCARPASKLLNNLMSYLSQAEPRVHDLPQPVCSAGSCEIGARQQWQEVLLQVGRDAQIEVNQAYACRRCGKTSGLSKCSRCCVISYCSRDCQKADWPAHKQVCIPAPQLR